MSDEKVRKAEPAPVGVDPAAKSALDAPSVPRAVADPEQASEPGGGSKSRGPLPRPSAPRPAKSEVPADVLPTTLAARARPPLGADKFSGLPRPSVPLPPPSEKTLGRADAVKLPPPPIAASRPPQQVQSAAPPQPFQSPPSRPAILRRQAVPRPRTTSAPPAPPRTGFMAAVDPEQGAPRQEPGGSSRAGARVEQGAGRQGPLRASGARRRAHRRAARQGPCGPSRANGADARSQACVVAGRDRDGWPVRWTRAPRLPFLAPAPSRPS